MPNPLNLTFDDGAPLDATKLQQLVTYLNDVNANSMRLPDFDNLANQAIAQRMSAGVAEFTNVKLGKAASYFDVQFKPPLVSDPASVVITVETNASDAAISYYLRSYNANGCKVALNRVAAVDDKTGKVVFSETTYGSVKIHYFAVAKSSPLG